MKRCSLLDDKRHPLLGIRLRYHIACPNMSLDYYPRGSSGKCDECKVLIEKIRYYHPAFITGYFPACETCYDDLMREKAEFERDERNELEKEERQQRLEIERQK